MTEENDSNEEDNIPLTQLGHLNTIMTDNELTVLIHVYKVLENGEDLSEPIIVKNIKNNSDAVK